jgi:hypothetical protein
MQTHAFADAGFAIPPCPAWARPVLPARTARMTCRQLGGMRRRLAALSPVQEASLVGIIALLAAWGLAELVLLLQGL